MAAEEKAKIEQPDQRQNSLEKELESAKAQVLRLQADFDNAKKRWLKEQAEFEEVANSSIMREFLEIFDDFDRALKTAAPSVGNQDVRAGLEMIYKRMESFLKSYGVIPMEAIGQLFDPRLHEAVAHEETEIVPESTVLSELRRGYLMNSRVLRPAVVKVAVKRQPQQEGD